MDLLFFKGCCLQVTVSYVVTLQSADGIPDTVMDYGSIRALYLGNFPVLLSLHKAGLQTTKLLWSKCGKRRIQLSQQKLLVPVCFTLEQNLLSRADLFRKMILYFRGFVQGIGMDLQISPGVIIETMFLPNGNRNLV